MTFNIFSDVFESTLFSLEDGKSYMSQSKCNSIMSQSFQHYRGFAIEVFIATISGGNDTVKVLEPFPLDF